MDGVLRSPRPTASCSTRTTTTTASTRRSSSTVPGRRHLRRPRLRLPGAAGRAHPLRRGRRLRLPADADDRRVRRPRLAAGRLGGQSGEVEVIGLEHPGRGAVARDQPGTAAPQHRPGDRSAVWPLRCLSVSCPDPGARDAARGAAVRPVRGRHSDEREMGCWPRCPDLLHCSFNPPRVSSYDRPPGSGAAQSSVLNRTKCHRGSKNSAVTAPGRPGRWEQDQRLTATVTATAAANG